LYLFFLMVLLLQLSKSQRWFLQKTKIYDNWLVTNVDLSQILDFLVLFHRASPWISFPLLREGVDRVNLPFYICLYLNLYFLFSMLKMFINDIFYSVMKTKSQLQTKSLKLWSNVCDCRREKSIVNLWASLWILLFCDFHLGMEFKATAVSKITLWGRKSHLLSHPENPKTCKKRI
jgi:hypothetical protein